ncbi:MAG: hypothetical protein IM558_07895 [Chitinophagaceae bacterium]|nr:hypothetical protein [Chitinophagaceae bacterium]MCA6497641.1 hypothetical protein [Chitinophagaceae bacterium]MCA6512494.1 hypothetical protein [Chitinophagaceae bacterium]
MKKISTCFFLFFLWQSMSAQPFGGTPASFQWKEISTDTVRIIFPANSETEARRIAGLIHRLQRTDSAPHRRISILLRDQTMISNGYVGLAPWRSEWYTTPPRSVLSLGAIRWNDMLAIHEWKHVQQYNRMNTGLSKTMRFLLGEQGQAVANALAVPDWFFEGEAVDQETRLTPQGRGRLPRFMNQLAAFWQSNPPGNYAYLRNGSLRKYVPDHYALGYLLVAHGRKKFGETFWEKVSKEAAAYETPFYPFQSAIRKYTGNSFTTFVQDAVNEYKRNTRDNATISAFITPIGKKGLTDYLMPVREDEDHVIVVKKDDRAIPGFYRVGRDGKEEKIADRWIAIDDFFSYRNGRIIYASYDPDRRWGNHDYSRLVIVNTRTGKSNSVVRSTKLATPDIHSEGNQILAAELLPGQDAAIILMDTTGTIEQRVHLPFHQLSEPRFACTKAGWFATARNNNGEMSLVYHSGVIGDTLQTLLPWTNRIISQLQIQQDTLLFTTTGKGSDEIWAMVTKEKGSLFRLATYPTGTYQGALWNQQQLVATHFTGNGHRLGLIEPKWQKIEIADALFPFLQGLPEEPSRINLSDTTGNSLYAVRRFRTLQQPLNLHSLRPFFDLPEYSLTVYGENLLKTLTHQFQYLFNQNEGSHRLSYDGIFGGTYLQPLVGAQQTWNRTIQWNADTVVNFNEGGAYAGFRLPLNFSGQQRFRFFNFQSTMQWNRVNYTGQATKWLKGYEQWLWETAINYTSQVQQSRQQIFPRFAHAIQLTHRQSLADLTARQWLMRGTIWLPGFTPVHHWIVSASWQTRDTARQYFFSNRFPFARGYQAIDFPDLVGVNLNYHFPVAYPEKGLAQVVYLLRMRAALFYDHTVGISRRTGQQRLFNSAGTELYFDTRWWNQLPVSFGIRYSRLLQPDWQPGTGRNRWEIILPVNLLN